MPRSLRLSRLPRASALAACYALALAAALPVTAQADEEPQGGPRSGSDATRTQPMGPGMHQGMHQGMPSGIGPGMQNMHPGGSAGSRGANEQERKAGRTLGASPAPGGSGIDASGDYRQEMQACRQGRTPQDRATCMEEARNARAASRRGALETPAESLEANAMARCRDLSPSETAACRARIMGYGQSSGSVAGGGVLRELEVIEMQPGQETVTVAPKGNAPVLVVPPQGRSQKE